MNVHLDIHLICKYYQGFLQKFIKRITLDSHLNVHTLKIRNCTKLDVNLCPTKHRQTDAGRSYTLGPLLWNSLAIKSSPNKVFGNAITHDVNLFCDGQIFESRLSGCQCEYLENDDK